MLTTMVFSPVFSKTVEVEGIKELVAMGLFEDTVG